MNWKDHLRDDEREELARAEASRDAAREVYNATVRKLKSRAEARRNRSVSDILRTGGMAEARRLLRAAKGDGK